jgi:energy-coupling factor transport system permease protein
MSDFEFAASVTIGQYVPTGSVLHRLDPRSKLLIVVLLIAGLIISSNLTGILGALILLAGSFALSRIPFYFALRGLRHALPLIVFLALLQILAIPANDTGVVLARFWIIVITLRDLKMGCLIMARLAALILLISLFSLVTSTRELTHGTERLLKPLTRIKFPAHEVALIMTIALRFIPILAIEAEHIAKAQASRGADFGDRRGGAFALLRIFKRARRILPIILPLFLASLRRAETLVLAMEARCYTGGEGRTHLVRFKVSWRDTVVIISAVVVLGVLLLLEWIQVDRSISNWIIK